MMIRVAYLFSWEGSSLILEFVLDFRKDNLMILLNKSPFPYRRPILLDFRKDNLMMLVKKSLFPYPRPNLPRSGLIVLTNLLRVVGRPARGLRTPDGCYECTVWVVPMWFGYTRSPWASSCGGPGDGSVPALGLWISGFGPIGHGTHKNYYLYLLGVRVNWSFFVSFYCKSI